MKFESFAKCLGIKLAEIRRQRGMSQPQLAQESGISLKYVAMIETGANPSIRMLLRFCEALGTDLTDVMEQAGIGVVPGRKPAKLRDIQVDLEDEDPSMRKLLGFLRGLDPERRRRALRLLRAAFKGK